MDSIRGFLLNNSNPMVAMPSNLADFEWYWSLSDQYKILLIIQFGVFSLVKFT
jgi:hypothetical protein